MNPIETIYRRNMHLLEKMCAQMEVEIHPEEMIERFHSLILSINARNGNMRLIGVEQIGETKRDQRRVNILTFEPVFEFEATLIVKAFRSIIEVKKIDELQRDIDIFENFINRRGPVVSY